MKNDSSLVFIKFWQIIFLSSICFFFFFFFIFWSFWSEEKLVFKINIASFNVLILILLEGANYCRIKQKNIYTYISAIININI